MLKVIQLDKTYGSNKHSLKAVNFTAKPGEVTAIIGPSGAGKTTILRSINQLIRDDSGQILLDDTDIRQANKAELRKVRHHIGMIFQNYNLVPILNVYENIVLPVELDGDTVNQGFMDEVVHMLALEDKLKNMPNNLSGGQQQRVAIARAIVNEPAILLADEPTGNLDPTNSWEIMKLLEEANDRGTTVLVVTHNQEIVNEMNERVITMKQGVIVSDEKKGGYIDED